MQDGARGWRTGEEREGDSKKQVQEESIISHTIVDVSGDGGTEDVTPGEDTLKLYMGARQTAMDTGERERREREKCICKLACPLFTTLHPPGVFV